MKNQQRLSQKEDEIFVDVSAYLRGTVSVEMKYYESRLPGAISHAYLRKEVADRLAEAASYLPKGFRYLIYDAWRPCTVQKALYDAYFCRLAGLQENQSLTVAELHRATQVFVSYPEHTKDIGYVHSSGGAIDLTILDPNGRELDMGCAFDDFTEIAFTEALKERAEMAIAHENRMLLRTTMQKAGFTNLESEWWHFDFGDTFWARATKQPLVYTSVYAVDQMTFENKMGD